LLQALCGYIRAGRLGVRLADGVPYFSNGKHYVSAIFSNHRPIFFDSRFEAIEREQELSDDEGDIEPES
jgi:hypothetical protein